MTDDPKTISTFSSEERHFEPSPEFRARARIKSAAEYQALYHESIDHPETFWERETSELVFHTRARAMLEWNLPHAKWFVGATLNASESCLDRHLATATKDKIALVWEGEPGDSATFSYAELHREVVALAATLRGLGIGKGDRVAIYMGMVPEVVVAMLACARIGAPHSVVFGGFAAESLRDRINDCGARLVLTQDGAWRRGHVVPLKATVDRALESAPSVEKVLVLRRIGEERAPIDMKPGRDLDWEEAIRAADPARGEAPEIVDAEHPLFILYTSGSTGKPKGVLHTTAGFLAGVHVTTKYVFDLRDDDVYWCTADVGWVTGHSYTVYGPLSNGATAVMYEGAPNFPDWGRFWELIDKHRVSILYTAPTAIRAFIRQGTSYLEKADLSSLRLLGSVGEPINPEAWIWYYENVGRKRCPIVDTWWQTETGMIMMTTLPGAHFAKPGSTGLPFFGVKPAVVQSDGTELGPNQGGLLVIQRPWPAMLRTIWGDDERYEKQYFSEVSNAYFSGDGARRDEDGYFHVVGRIDDVLNVAGHRIGTAEIESALVAHPAVAEAAAVGRPDDLKGQSLVVFVTLKPPAEASDEMRAALAEHVGAEIGKFARPDEVRFADGLPKTRSGKIMRRLLKDIAAGRGAQGDLSTLEDARVLDELSRSEE
ncbi:MAG: acetate--CoA ligase [Sorangiineae bacterium]|nr:acetate--CoA ligase [Polyangiaceae bacterium]MEB2323267.1 acetate--CoA ligase [Sorangiineae bacterium]